MRISYWSSDVCSSDLSTVVPRAMRAAATPDDRQVEVERRFTVPDFEADHIIRITEQPVDGGLAGADRDDLHRHCVAVERTGMRWEQSSGGNGGDRQCKTGWWP